MIVIVKERGRGLSLSVTFNNITTLNHFLLDIYFNKFIVRFFFSIIPFILEKFLDNWRLVTISYIKYLKLFLFLFFVF